METTYYTIKVHRSKTNASHSPEPKQGPKAIHIALILSAFIISTVIYMMPNVTQHADGATNGAIINDDIVRNAIPVTGIKIGTEVQEIELPTPEVVETPAPALEECLGDSIIETGSAVLVMQQLPDAYYPGINFSKFQPYMDWSMVTNPNSAAYTITRSENAYVDENGYRRYKTTDDQFTIDGADDFVVALGTFYKPKGTCGQRFLIITTGGMYTVICGDEKADIHTDDMNMFSWHGSNHEYAGMIEWIVDQKVLYKNDNIASRMGSIHYSSNPALAGDIIMMYRID